MVGLNLSARSKKRLPVTTVPEWAEEYFCDNCGRDVTKQVRRQQSHSWQPMGAKDSGVPVDTLGSPARQSGIILVTAKKEIA
jgi:hypothetical protein